MKTSTDHSYNPLGYSHTCDNSASYSYKKVPVKKPAWTKITDVSGRGFPKDDVDLFKGKESSQNRYMNLDENNRL